MAHVKTVEARFWPGPSGKSPFNLLRCSIFARKRVSSTLVDRLLENGIPTTMARALEGWILEI